MRISAAGDGSSLLPATELARNARRGLSGRAHHCKLAEHTSGHLASGANYRLVLAWIYGPSSS